MQTAVQQVTRTEDQQWSVKHMELIKLQALVYNIPPWRKVLEVENKAMLGVWELISASWNKKM